MNAVTIDRLVKRVGPFTLAVEHLDIPAEGITGIAGHNGAGKSTLLGIVALLDRPDCGNISLFGEPAATGGARRLRQRREVSLLTQETVLFSCTVRENIACGLKLRGMGAKETERRVTAALEELALAPLADRRAAELSGGEARRVAFARAIVVPAKLYLFDEPATAADTQSGQLIEAAVARLAAAGSVVVFATHDGAQMERLAVRRITLENGRVI